MAVITNPAKRKSLSILASDLIGGVTFDAKQTLPVMDIASNEYNEGMNLYLQKLGVSKLDAEYNAAVKQFELQLEEQELAAKLQANVAAESTANMAVEAQPGLGTGAAAVASEGRQSMLDAVHSGIESSIAETYQTGMGELAEDYREALEVKLGEYNAETGTFEGLANYEVLSNKVTEAMFKALALMVDPDADTSSTTSKNSYISILKNAGLLDASTSPGEYVLSALGEEHVDMLVNNADVNKANPALGGKTLAYVLAEEMGKADYALSEGENDVGWSSLSDAKKDSIIREYQSWIYNNQNNLRLTSWDLYERTENGYELDVEFSTPAIDAPEGVYGDKGTYITQLSVKSEDNPAGAPDCSESELAQTKKEILSGKIPDGSYFTFQRGEMYDNDKYYYVKDNVVYSTKYTAADPPPVISVDSATVRSFGIYNDVGSGDGDQDKWVSKAITAAKAGKIPDGSYIRMNYGLGSGGYYRYESGEFIKVSGDTEIQYYSSSSGKWLTTTLNRYSDIHGDTEVPYIFKSSVGGDSHHGKYINWKD